MVTTEIIRLLREYKRKPYMPVWGELFALLYHAKRKAEKENAVTEVYTIGNHVVVYDPVIHKFCCQLGDLTFRLTIEELTDSLVSGAFAPDEAADRRIS